MLTFRKILVPTDLSALSVQAIPYAAALARPHHSKIFVAHFSRSGSSGDAMSTLAAPYIKALTKFNVVEILEAADAIGGIVDFAAREKVDLIVMSTHGRTGLQRRVLGSVAESVVRHAPCPVMVCRPVHSSVLAAEELVGAELADEATLPEIIPVLAIKKRPPSKEDLYFAKLDQELVEQARRQTNFEGWKPALRLRCILAPTDFSSSCDLAVSYAVELAQSCGAKIHLLHVAEVPTDLYTSFTNRLDSPDFEFPQLEDLTARLRGAQESLGSVCRGVSLSFGNPRWAILAVAAREQADLIVMATHGRHGLSRMVLGSTTAGVVRRSPCPVVRLRNAPGSYSQPPQKTRHDAVEVPTV